MQTGLENRVVMITGASGGIGGACARAFAAEGARLVLHANQNAEAARSLADELDVPTLVAVADLTDEAQTRRLFAEAAARFGGVDALVANAGVWEAEPEPIDRMSLERWHRAIDADQTSVFLCAREFFAALRRAKPDAASLTLVGSTAAIFGEEGHVEYAAAKAAVTYGLTRTLKNEIVRIVPGGRVNAVCPGWTRTPMAEGAIEDATEVNRALSTSSLRRIAEPEDIAHAVVFLASDRLARHITGQILTVAGGMEGRLIHPA